MKEIFIYGAGGFGREVLWLSKSIKELQVIGFLDDDTSITICENLPVQHAVKKDMQVVIAIANSLARKKIVQNAVGIQYLNLVHPDSDTGMQCNMGGGNIICKGVICTTHVAIANHVIINLNATIGHDTEIENFVSIMPGVHISGNVHIGEGVLIGTGAVILPGITIGKWSKVGAGAVITKDVPDNAVVAGVPGRLMK